MRAELAIGQLLSAAGYVAATTLDAPDFTTKCLGILTGTIAGALISAMVAETATTHQRIRRGVASGAAGPIISLIALSFWPSHASMDPREWVFIVAGIASAGAWHLVRKLDERGDAAADTVLDIAARRVGLSRKRPKAPRNEAGRARLVLLVLLAGLALLAYVFRDLLGLLWAIATGWVGH